MSFFHCLTQFHQVKASINKAKSIPVCLYVSKPKHLALIFTKLRRFDQQSLQSVANNLCESLFNNRRLVIIEPFQHRRLVSCPSFFFERVLLNLLKKLVNSSPKFFIFHLKLSDILEKGSSFFILKTLPI